MAGLEVALRSGQSDGLSSIGGAYDCYPSGGVPPEVVLDFELTDGFADEAPWADHPQFRRESLGPNRLGLKRFDAEGEISVWDEPPRVRAKFRGDRYTNTLEAPIRIAVSAAVALHNGLLLHASAIEHQGEALVFLGESGAGKSTIAAMLSGLDSCRSLSDELLIVTPGAHRHDRHRAWVAPFIGSDGLPHGASAPIKGLYFLRQAAEHRCSPLATPRALEQLMRCTLSYSPGPRTTQAVLDAGIGLLSTAAPHVLEFAKDLGVAQVLDIT